MRVIVSALLLCSVLSASLRAQQDPAQTMLDLFFKGYQSTIGLFEGFILSQVYGDQAKDIQAQLDQCTVNRVMADEQTIKADLMGLLGACSQSDPLAPAAKIMQDAFQSIAVWATPCPGMSVNVLGDLQTMVANAFVQGNSFVAPFVGPVLQLSAPLLQQGPQYLQPILELAVSAAQAAGVSDQTLGTLQGDAQAIQAAVAKAIQDEMGEALTPEDITAISNLAMKMAMDDAQAGQEVLMGLAQFAEAPAQAVCAVMGPLMQNFSGFFGQA